MRRESTRSHGSRMCEIASKEACCSIYAGSYLRAERCSSTQAIGGKRKRKKCLKTKSSTKSTCGGKYKQKQLNLSSVPWRGKESPLIWFRCDITVGESHHPSSTLSLTQADTQRWQKAVEDKKPRAPRETSAVPYHLAPSKPERTSEYSSVACHCPPSARLHPHCSRIYNPSQDLLLITLKGFIWPWWPSWVLETGKTQHRKKKLMHAPCTTWDLKMFSPYV